MQSYDVIVVGAGGVGSAAMMSLAKRGACVLGIDRFAPPHSCGSSHGETRVIRQAYFEHPDYVPLLLDAYRLWHELEATAATKLFKQCGLLEVGPAAGEVVSGVLRAAAEHDLEVENLSAPEVARRWPALRVPEGLTAVYEPMAGYLYVERCVETMLDEARRRDARLVVDCQVHGWQATDDGVLVTTSQGKFTAGSLAITAGAWAQELLTNLAVPLQVLRKSLFWYATHGMPQAQQLPVFLYETDYGVPYGFPSIDGLQLKIADHMGGLPVEDPLRVDDAIVTQEQVTAERFLTECTVTSEVSRVEHKVCLYTMTPDHHFVVDRHPKHANVAFAAGLSGHGYKFAPVLGEVLADLLLDGRTNKPIDFLSASRFAGC